MRNDRARILIVDNESIDRSALEDELGKAGYSVATAASLLRAAKALASSTFEVVIANLHMPGQDSLFFLREVKKQNPLQAMIVLTNFNKTETAVEAMKIGAFDYLQRPFSAKEVLLKIDKLLRYERVASENKDLRHQIVLRRIENQTIASDKKDQAEPAAELEFTVPPEPSGLLSLELSGIERVNIETVLEDIEVRLIHWAMEKAEGNLSKAADLLGLPCSTLQYKINRRSSSTDSLLNKN